MIRQKLAMGDYVELVGKPSDSNNQITVTAIPYIIRKIAVADHKADCVGVVPQSCLLTKPADQASSQRDWEYRYNGIEGFNY